MRLRGRGGRTYIKDGDAESAGTNKDKTAVRQHYRLPARILVFEEDEVSFYCRLRQQRRGASESEREEFGADGSVRV
jgi:hypothetical protein